ncbi:hypothetical protein GQ457_12G031940 [Hibiscus cannabinus]
MESISHVHMGIFHVHIERSHCSMALHGAGFLSVSSNGPSLVVSLASPASLSEPLGPPGVRVSRSLARAP